MSDILRWKRNKPRWGSTTHELSRGGKWLAIVQELKSGSNKWFWYSSVVNTASNPTNLETAKKEAKAHIIKTNQ